MENIKVSVIIPVYNTEKYLEEAINSVVNQTLKEIEIIVVNDGSTDNSATILEDFAKKDSRVKVLTLEKNSGQSVARNVGMEIMKGEYLYFFDSDDVLESDCLELCYEKSKAENLDFLFFDALTFYDVESDLKLNYQQTTGLEPKVYTGAEILRILLKKKLHKDTLWLNFIKTSYVKRLKLSFIPHICYEDAPFVIRLYAEATRVNFIGRNFFHRRIRENSIMSSKLSKKNIDDLLFVVNEIAKYKNAVSDSELRRLLGMKIRIMLISVTKKMLKINVKTIVARMPQVVKLYVCSL